MKRKILAIMLTLTMIFALVPSINVSAATSRDALKKNIKAKTSKTILKSYFYDYDGNGEKELFAVVGDKNEDADEIWFSSSKQTKKVYGDNLAVYYTDAKRVKTINKKQKLFIEETGAYGSSSVSVCYYVKNGKVKKASKAGEQLTQTSGNKFAVYMTAFDGMKLTGDKNKVGHTWKKYYLKWNGTKFIEYKGSKISANKVKSYKNGKTYLNKIKKAGYKIGTIYKRSNGIININCSKKTEEGVYYENVTLKLSGKTLKLVKIDKSGKNIVQQSSYGGSYKASGF
ncbi:MAG: hypothetical protein Q4E73_09600 [Lachnospiraceae bacterium]|nr:hypothetical protein [Lachnospiraceae bacterium]